MDVLEVQANRSYIINLIREELLNKESITNALIPIEERNSRSAKRLLSTLDEMINIEENKKEVLEMRQLKLFKRLLFEDKVGRIDTYSFNGIKGRKIMISEKFSTRNLE